MKLINKLLFFTFLSFFAWSCGEEGDNSDASPSEQDVNDATGGIRIGSYTNLPIIPQTKNPTNVGL